MSFIKMLIGGAAVGGTQTAIVMGIGKAAEVASKHVRESLQNKAWWGVGTALTTIAGGLEIYAAKSIFHDYWNTASSFFGEDSKMVKMTGAEYAKIAPADHH